MTWVGVALLIDLARISIVPPFERMRLIPAIDEHRIPEIAAVVPTGVQKDAVLWIVREEVSLDQGSQGLAPIVDIPLTGGIQDVVDLPGIVLRLQGEDRRPDVRARVLRKEAPPGLSHSRPRLYASLIDSRCGVHPFEGPHHVGSVLGRVRRVVVQEEAAVRHAHDVSRRRQVLSPPVHMQEGRQTTSADVCVCMCKPQEKAKEEERRKKVSFV